MVPAELLRRLKQEDRSRLGVKVAGGYDHTTELQSEQESETLALPAKKKKRRARELKNHVLKCSQHYSFRVNKNQDSNPGPTTNSLSLKPCKRNLAKVPQLS